VPDLDHRKPTRAARPHRAGKPKWSHSAIGAAVVAGAAMVAAFAFIITNGTPSEPPTGSAPGAGRDVAGTSTTPSGQPSSDPAPSLGTAKADRSPAVSQKASPPPPNTGPQSPRFKAGQWIVMLDSYSTDSGMDADQVAQAAKTLAGQLITAGVPAKAMLANGQYPGLADGSLRPMTNTWVVYLGPFATAEAGYDLCVAPKTQKIHSDVSCPTYEPATRLG
jgi:hypothetical protein